MISSFLTLNSEVLERWQASAEATGISPDTYFIEAKRVSNPQNTVSFGVFRNSHRFNRPQQKKPSSPTEKPSCPLCTTLDDIAGDSIRNMTSQEELPGYVVIPNLFPATIGHTLAITSGTGENELPMYDTQSLDSLAHEMEKVFGFTDKTGFRAYHNGKDSGASVTSHEHWHLTNFSVVYEMLGERYGLDSAEIVSLNGFNGVSTMGDFPFAHLIFDQDDPERITNFLRKIQAEIGGSYEDGTIPHGIAQAENGRGILVTPTKNCMTPGLPGIGSGDMAGHIPVKTQEEFDSASYESCIRKLDQRLYRTEDIDLTQFL